MKMQEYMLKALQDAVQMELEGRQFYLEAAKKAQSPGVRDILEFLAESETYHIEKFNQIYRSLEKDPAWTEPLAAFQPPKHEPYVCVLAMAKEGQGSGGKDDLQALRTGMKMEECSIDYYTKLAKEIANPLARRFFMSIAHAADGLIAVDGGHGTISEAAIGLKLGKPVIGLRTSWDLPGLKKAKSAQEAIALVFQALGK